MSELPLEKLLSAICDTSDMAEAEIREELAAVGIDLEEARAKLVPRLSTMLAARAVRIAELSIKENNPSFRHPLPWKRDGKFSIADANGLTLAGFTNADGRNYALIAANAALVLAAEVERLQGLLTTSELLRAEDAMDTLKAQAQVKELKETVAALRTDLWEMDISRHK